MVTHQRIQRCGQPCIETANDGKRHFDQIRSAFHFAQQCMVYERGQDGCLPWDTAQVHAWSKHDVGTLQLHRIGNDDTQQVQVTAAAVILLTLMRCSTPIPSPNAYIISGSHDWVTVNADGHAVT
jgi:hypothetical protein